MPGFLRLSVFFFEMGTSNMLCHGKSTSRITMIKKELFPVRCEDFGSFYSTISAEHLRLKYHRVGVFKYIEVHHSSNIQYKFS